MGWYSVIVKLEGLQERRRKDGGEKARRCRCERRCESCVGQVKADMQQKKEPVQDDSDLDRKRRETEALLQSIGISPEPPLEIEIWNSSVYGGVYQKFAVVSYQITDQLPVAQCLQLVTRHHRPTAYVSVARCDGIPACRRRLHKLGVSKVTQVDFLPREVVSYSKETQTPLATHQSEEQESDRPMTGTQQMLLKDKDEARHLRNTEVCDDPWDNENLTCWKKRKPI
ncbi:hypothetical protein CB1_000369003 [Camelus ferus]|nr:hypothetical protein CB1_000369003 [Camelus ferus]